MGTSLGLDRDEISYLGYVTEQLGKWLEDQLAFILIAQSPFPDTLGILFFGKNI
jgi:hypothetical protein